MSEALRFPVEPWAVREVGLHIDDLARSESVFSLSNGHIGLRGNLDEGEPVGTPGTYLGGFCEARPLPSGEAAYGMPESNDTLVNVSNGKVIRLLVDDEPLDLRYGTLHGHERVLDLGAGTLARTLDWTSPAGQRVKVRSTRLVSFDQRAVVAIRYEVEPVGAPARVMVSSELVTNEEGPSSAGDPRTATATDVRLEALDRHADRDWGYLIHRTPRSGLTVAAGMIHEVDGPKGTYVRTDVLPDLGETTIGCQLEAGEVLTITKYVSYGWSSTRSVPALRDQVMAALVSARLTGWQGLLDAQRAYLDHWWDVADIQLEGDGEHVAALQQAVRFAAFHVLQAGARAERRGIAAKGLTGTGYDGHVFWDSEMYVLPLLVATMPRSSEDALRWRLSTLEDAKARAATLGLGGAAFPWRTIRGRECSGYWPASTAAFHVNAAIAAAAVRQVAWTGDVTFACEVALPLLVETARLWMTLGHHGKDGHFHIDGVTGPDEYSAIVDDNAYTNLMAQENLTAAAVLVDAWGDAAAQLEVTAEEAGAWRAAAAVMHVPMDRTGQVRAQDADFTGHELWDFQASFDQGAYPLLLHAHYFELYRKQVCKQADLALALHWRGDAFTAEERARAFAYYEPLTVRDSSLSACTQAIVAAGVGQLDLAQDYLLEAALMDLRDLQHNTGNGVHIASLAGSWLALVAGFGGMRDHCGVLSFAPQLPPEMTRLCFAVSWQGRRLRVDVVGEEVTYRLATDAEGPITFLSYGQEVVLEPGAERAEALQGIEPLTPRPEQPPGRQPGPGGPSWVS